MGDIYVKDMYFRDKDGRIDIDADTFEPALIEADYQKAGSVLPKAYAGWENTFSYRGVTVNILFSGRFGGIAVSNTQAILDRYGVSEYSARLREKGLVSVGKAQVPAKKYLELIAAGTGEGDNYIYSATNVRLGELSIRYALPKKWTGNRVNVTLGLVGNNLAMLYCKAPFDPELVASESNSYYTGVDYFMQPALRSVGFSVKIQF
jgi:hypothetical protein